MVPYDTYIIFEQQLGAMLFARKYLKIKILLKLRTINNESDYIVFHWILISRKNTTLYNVRT